MTEYRREQAINQMLEYLKYTRLAEQAAKSFKGLALLSEVLEPDSVLDISLDKLNCKITSSQYVGHVAEYCGVGINVHTASSGRHPKDRIFRAVLDEFKSKGGMSYE